MIQYIKYQSKNKLTDGKWYLRAVTTETLGVDELSKHMAQHNTPYSTGVIKGVLTDMVSCIKELMLDGKAVKIGDLAIFSLGLKSKGADSAEEAKASLVTGYRFKARATGEMSISELKQAIQLRELKHYTGGEAIEDEEDNEQDSNQQPAGSESGNGNENENENENNEGGFTPPILS